MSAHTAAESHHMTRGELTDKTTADDLVSERKVKAAKWDYFPHLKTKLRGWLITLMRYFAAGGSTSNQTRGSSVASWHIPNT